MTIYLSIIRFLVLVVQVVLMIIYLSIIRFLVLVVQVVLMMTVSQIMFMYPGIHRYLNLSFLIVKTRTIIQNKTYFVFHSNYISALKRNKIHLEIKLQLTLIVNFETFYDQIDFSISRARTSLTILKNVGKKYYSLF